MTALMRPHDGCRLAGPPMKMGIENGQYPFPLISVDAAGLALALNNFQLPELNAGFSPLLAFDPTLAPRSFVPFSRHSPLHVVAEKIIPSVLKAMHDRKGRVTAKGLASVTVPTFDIMSVAQQNDIIKAVATVMNQAAKGHFAHYLKRNRPAAGVSGPSWDITNNPLDLGVDRRSKEFQKLLKLQRLLLADLRAGIAATEQLTFLDEEPTV
jgi:hypothetical protein